MEKYTIYCTEEQTRKAFNLGAPLEVGDGKRSILCKYRDYNTYKNCLLPTTEQMIGWLEEQPSIVTIGVNKSKCLKWEYFITKPGYNEIDSAYNYSSRKEATLEAIDTALDYLIKIKEK